MRALIARLLRALTATLSSSRGPHVGDKVFCRLRGGDRRTRSLIEKITIPATVDEVRGNWLRLGRAWVRKIDVMDAEQAWKYFSKEIREYPAGPRGWYGRGTVLIAMGEYANALEDFTEAIRCAPRTFWCYNGRGAAWHTLGELDKAILDYSESIRLAPESPGAYGNRAAAHYALNNLEQARTDFSEAIRLDPDDAAAYHGRGNVWDVQGDSANALADYTESLRLNPKSAEAYVARGGVRTRMGEWQHATGDFSEAIRLAPADASNYLYRAYAQEEAGHFAEAMRDYMRVIELDSSRVEGFNNLAWLWATCPDPVYRNGQQAVAYATKACEMTGWKTSYPVGSLAAAYAETGDFLSAAQFAEKSLVLAPENERQDAAEQLEHYRNNQPWRVFRDCARENATSAADAPD